jgi:hypothetical protein
MCAKTKTVYRQYTLYLDPEIPGDREIIDWLNKHHGKRNSFSTQIRLALGKIILEEKGDAATENKDNA